MNFIPESYYYLFVAYLVTLLVDQTYSIKLVSQK